MGVVPSLPPTHSTSSFFSIPESFLSAVVIAVTYCLKIKLQWVCLFPRDSQCVHLGRNSYEECDGPQTFPQKMLMVQPAKMIRFVNTHMYTESLKWAVKVGWLKGGVEEE